MKTQSIYGKNLTSFTDFKGVDFSSSPMDVSPNRASYMENFISEFGINQKRHGWCEMREFSTAADERLPICGIFRYETGAAPHIIVHAGERFYRLTESGYERIGEGLTRLTATRSQSFAQKGRMYIVGCGDYLVYGTWDEGKSYELRRVYDDEDTYIPVTSVSVGGSGQEGKLDAPNTLTPWRINRCVGVSRTLDSGGNLKEVGGTYIPDAPVDHDSKIVITNIVTQKGFEIDAVGDSGAYRADGAEVGRFYVEWGGFALSLDDASVLRDGFVLGADLDEYKGTGEKLRCQNGSIVRVAFEDVNWEEKGDHVFCGTYAITGNTLHVRCKNLLYDMMLNYEYGFIVSLWTSDAEAKLFYTDALKRRSLNTAANVDYVAGTITVNNQPSIWDDSYRYDSSYGEKGEDRFEIKFKSTKIWDDDGECVEVLHRDRIVGCAFGTVFGVGGASDRLFLSGNPIMKNADFFSEIDDFTYFPEGNVSHVGSDAVPIVGYSRLSDGVLAIFKQKSDVGDATIYYRKGTYKEYFDDLGNLDHIDAVFSVVAGNVGESPISRFTIKDFGGDKLFLSENGVFGIVLSENIVSGERYFRERSRRINARLCGEKDLSKATAIIYKNKYYLAVNGHCYVADARYRNAGGDNMDSAWGYEWWYLTGVPAAVFAEIDGELWFGTDDGMLCRFDDGYSDRFYQLCQVNDLDLSGGRIAVNTTLKELPKVGDIFITTSELFGVAYDGFDGVTADGRVIYSHEGSKLLYMAEGEFLVAVGTLGTGLSEDCIYTVGDVDLENGTFAIYRNGKRVVIENVGFSLLRPLKDRELQITEVGEDAKDFSVSFLGEVQRLTEKTNTPISLTGKIIFNRNVHAVWMSCMSSLGTAMAGKNLHRISITCESSLRGRLSFGYEVRPRTRMRGALGYTAPLSLETLDFSCFSFDTAFTSSYSVRIFERNVNYIRLRVESDTDTPCAFNRIELLWTYTRLLGGLR